MIGRRDRRSGYVAVTTLVAVVLAFPAFAAAESAEDGAVVESLAPSRQWPWGHWTPQRLEEAEPLPLITLPGPESPAAPEAPSATLSEVATTSALRTAVAGQSGAVEGVEVDASESTLFPNSANGKLFGTYEIPLGKHEFKKVDYVCSASVVKPPEGATSPKTEGPPPPSNVVVTAGHCVIDPETGTKTNTEMIFIPGYRNQSAPHGIWHAEFFTTTETWKNTATSGSSANEGGDLAFVGLKDNEAGEDVESAVGALGVGFDQACNQVYTQFGYPAEAPYNGELLYSHTTGYAGADTNSTFSPEPMKIASDFTRGASGGPWAVGIGTGASPPTVLSLTAYGYENQPGYLYGPYFGEAAKKAYGAAFTKILPAGIEETCAATPTPTPTPTPPTPSPPTPSPQPAPETTPVETPVTLKVTRVRRLASGFAVLTAKVNTAGLLQLSGAAVRAESLGTPAAGQYRLVVAPKGPTNRRLRQVGKAKVGISVAFSASGKTKRVSRKIALSRPSVARAAQQRAPQSR